VSRYQKGKTNVDFNEARDREWQWHQLGHMQVCISLQTDNHASTPTTQFFTGRMPFLLPNQQRQSTEGKMCPLNFRQNWSRLLQARCPSQYQIVGVRSDERNSKHWADEKKSSAVHHTKTTDMI